MNIDEKQTEKQTRTWGDGEREGRTWGEPGCTWDNEEPSESSEHDESHAVA